MNSEQLNLAARTVVDLASFLAELKTQAISIYEPQTVVARGYITPAEELSLRHLQLSYWKARCALFELMSEIWADAEVVATTYRRGSSRASVFARLASPSAFKAFKATLDADPRLQVEAQTTLDYFKGQSAGVSKVLRIIGIVVGSIMAIGAVFGALNTMFASVASRAREIATLRAIGFRGIPVVVAVMLETMLLAALGGVLGGLLAWLVFNGYTASTLAGGVAQLTFEFKVSPELLWQGLKWALAIGFVGGLFPAMRAATMPVTDALRAA
jgi:putative ABC transport system permease protein